MTGFQFRQVLVPGRQGQRRSLVVATAIGGERCQGRRQQADVRPVHALDLVDLGTVDIDVRNRPRLRREFRRIAGHAIVKARAQRNQEVAILDRVVGECRAVHT